MVRSWQVERVLGIAWTLAWMAGCGSSADALHGEPREAGGSASSDSQTGTPEGGSGMSDAGEPDTGREAGSLDDVEARPNDGAPSEGDADDARVDASDSGSGTDAGTDPCQGGTTYESSETSATPTSGFGDVQLYAPNSTDIVAFDTTLTVPPEPPATGTLFLWPGLQPLPGGEDFDVLDNGVLQSVLTWGGTCAPTAPSDPYASWWISAQYVNTFIGSTSPNYGAYNGCHGGQGMDVQVGDALDIAMTLEGSSWVETVTDPRTAKTISYSIDMLGQAQNWAEFVIEQYSATPVSDVIFTSTVLTFAAPEPASCIPAYRGTNDYFSAPRASPDGTRCCIAKVILRAQGVAATSPDTP